MKLREELLNIEMERVQTGEVRVSKQVVTEQKTINVPVSREISWLNGASLSRVRYVFGSESYSARLARVGAPPRAGL